MNQFGFRFLLLCTINGCYCPQLMSPAGFFKVQIPICLKLKGMIPSFIKYLLFLRPIFGLNEHRNISIKLQNKQSKLMESKIENPCKKQNSGALMFLIFELTNFSKFPDGQKLQMTKLLVHSQKQLYRQFKTVSLWLNFLIHQVCDVLKIMKLQIMYVLLFQIIEFSHANFILGAELYGSCFCKYVQSHEILQVPLHKNQALKSLQSLYMRKIWIYRKFVRVIQSNPKTEQAKLQVCFCVSNQQQYPKNRENAQKPHPPLEKADRDQQEKDRQDFQSQSNYSALGLKTLNFRQPRVSQQQRAHLHYGKRMHFPILISIILYSPHYVSPARWVRLRLQNKYDVIKFVQQAIFFVPLHIRQVIQLSL